jgi:hypothetical protein
MGLRIIYGENMKAQSYFVSNYRSHVCVYDTYEFFIIVLSKIRQERM